MGTVIIFSSSTDSQRDAAFVRSEKEGTFFFHGLVWVIFLVRSEKGDAV